MLTKQAVNINFSKGVDTKTDPWQLPVGTFLSLQNSVFTTQGQLRKRNGYGLVTTIAGSATVTTFSGNLVSIGTNSLNLYSEDTNTVIDTGYIQPMGLSVLPMVRRASAQTTVDISIASNGLACSTWLDSDGNSYYQINDSVTGGTIVPAVALTTATDVSATMSRVFALGNYFVITYMATVSGSPTFRYVAVPINNLTSPLAPVTISTSVSSISAAYDCVVAKIAPDVLFLAWNGGSTDLVINYMTASLALGTGTTVASTSSQLISTTWDYALNQLWVSFYSSSGNTIDVVVYTQSLVNILAKTNVVSSVTLNNGLTSTANSGTAHIFYEVSNFYGFDSGLRTDYISKNSCTNTGTAGTPAIIVRGMGLGSKATYLSSTNKSYMLCAYGTSYQPSYFLIDSSGFAIGKLAYENGGGLIINQILPQINATIVAGEPVFQIGYLKKDFLSSIANPVGPAGSNTGTNKTIGATNPAPIYTQTGINLSEFTFNQPAPTAESGSILHMGAGFPWMFDGVKPVEHQFHLWPDAVEVSTSNYGGGLAAQQYYYQAIYYWTDGQGNPQQSAPSIPVTANVVSGVASEGHSFTATFTLHATTMTLTSGTATVGMVLADYTTAGNLLAGTYITGIAGSTISLSQETQGASASSPGDTLVVVAQNVTSGVFAKGVNTFTVSSAAALFVGQTITDLTNAGTFPANTTITSIVGTTITISALTTAVSTDVGDVLQVTGIGTATVYIPTLRLTYKWNPPSNTGTANKVIIRLYRWSAAQEEFFEVTSVSSPTLNDPTVDYVTFTDTQSDAAIEGNSLIYTTGGVLEDIAAPSFSICSMFDDRLWVVDAEDPYTLWYSKQVIENTGVEFSDLLTYYVAPTQGAQGSTGPVTALCPMDTELVIFKKDAAYYVNGTGPDNTGANGQYSQPIFITSTVGCDNVNSIVLTDDGIMFQSDKGIWLVGRNLQTSYIGAPVEKYVLGNTVTSAIVVPGTTQARFTLNTGVTLMYDYFYNQWGPFSISGISATLYNGQHTMLNSYGQILQETPNLYLDISNPVLMSFTTSWLNLAGVQGYQRAYFFYPLGMYLSPHKLQFAVAYDYNPSPTQVTLIQPNNFSSAVPSNFGVPVPMGSKNNVENWRVFLARQRCSSVQITFNEIYDPTFGVPAGAGLTMTGLNVVAGLKKSFRPISQNTSAGGGNNTG